MAKDDDLDVDARLQDSWQYRIKMVDGSVEHLRDHDNLSSVKARIIAAKAASSPLPQNNLLAPVDASHVDFSGGRAVEGGTDEEPVIGPVRGKGFVDATRIALVCYSSTDGTEISGQAFEAAVAMLDVQRAALAQLAEAGQGQGAGAGAEGESAGEGLIG